MSSDIITSVKGGMQIGHGSFVMGMEILNPNAVSVIAGKYCSIALYLQVVGYDHACISVPKAISSWPFDAWWGLPSFPGQLNSTGYHKKSNIIIGNDVWIGQSVALRPGITIGDGAIIGACSLVTKDVKPYEIVGGNPIRHIRYRYTEDQITKLLQIKWWNWPESKIRQLHHLFYDIDTFLLTVYGV
jgi:acetyltransferase-like isoleucine patch superfamily enzyme